MKVGDKFWSFDGNRRKYDTNRRLIHREHFYAVQIIKETSRSWVIGHIGSDRELFKVPKSDPFRTKYGEFTCHPMIFTAAMVDDDCLVAKHSIEIADAVRRTTAENLRKIASLIGYDLESPEA